MVARVAISWLSRGREISGSVSCERERERPRAYPRTSLLLSSPLFLAGAAASAAKDRCPSKYKFAKSNRAKLRSFAAVCAAPCVYCRWISPLLLLHPLLLHPLLLLPPLLHLLRLRALSLSLSLSLSSPFTPPVSRREPCRLVLRHHRILLDVLLVPLSSTSTSTIYFDLPLVCLLSSRRGPPHGPTASDPHCRSMTSEVRESIPSAASTFGRNSRVRTKA